MTVSPETRIACDVSFFFVPAAVVVVRFYLRIIKQYHRRWTRAAIWGEVFIAILLSAATSVIVCDIWTHVREIQLRGPETPSILAVRKEQDIAYFKVCAILQWPIRGVFDKSHHGCRRILTNFKLLRISLA